MANVESLLFITVQFILLSTAFSLKCHSCSTIDHPQCKDPYHPPDEGYGGSHNFYQQCPDTIPRNVQTNSNATMKPVCRKIVQKVNDDVRIIRQCGFEEEKKPVRDCIKKPGSVGIQHTYCYCRDEDLCNGSTVNLTHPLLIIVGVLIAIKQIFLTTAN